MSECPKVHYVSFGFKLQLSKINLNYSQYMAGTIINVNYNLCLLNMPDVLMRLVLYIWCPNSFQIYTEQKRKRNNYIPLNFEQTMIQSEIIAFSTSA